MSLTIALAGVAAWLAFKNRHRAFGRGGGTAPAEPPRWMPYRWVYPRTRRLAWLRMVPTWVRRLVRWTALGLVVGWNMSPVLTVLVALLVGGLGGYAGHRTRDRRRHFRNLVVPLWITVAGMLRVPEGESIREWLRVPYRLEADNARVTLRVPRDFRGTDMERHEITALMERRLPGEWEATWDWGAFQLIMKHPPAPPKFVAFADVVAQLMRSPEARPLVGLGTRGDGVHGDFDQEAPHWALSMGTGAGKSTFLRVVIAQLARHTGKPGGVEHIDICDPKRISLNCFRGVPGIDIHKTAEAWVKVVREFRFEMEHRYDVLDGDEKATFPRRFLVIEEMNSFTRLIQEWWNSIREKSDPRTPPVMNDLAFILNQGRQAKMHVISIFQQMNARAAGGSEARDQYGMKILARFSPAAWNMLVGTSPRPKSSRHPGRAIVLVGDDQRTIQMVYMTPEEAHEFALNGRAPVAPPVTSPLTSLNKPGTSLPGSTPVSVPGQSPDITGRNGHVGAVAEGDENGRVPLFSVPNPAPTPDPEPVTGLKDAADFLGMEWEAFKKARQRDPIAGEFRRGTSPAWAPEALTEWHLNRPRAGARTLKEEAAS
jgi:hypothetical protein